MDRNGVDWEGPFTAMITPFHPDGEIDESGLRDHVEFLVAHGVRGLVPNGCTGEFWAQTTEGDGNFNMFAFLEKGGAEVLVEP